MTTFQGLTWQDFYQRQEEISALTGVAHIPVKIRYILAGTPTKGTILLMHGIPTWSFLYRNVLDPLVAAGYQVLAPDFLGHGFSDQRDKFDRSFQDQARMIVRLLEELDIISTPVHVVGHDTGGAVALILAIERASLVDRLVLTNAVCYDSFDDDMLDFGHPTRWKNKSVEDLMQALDESLAAGLQNRERLTRDFGDGIKAPWSTEQGKLSLMRNAAALNANQTMALVDRHGTIQSKTLLLWAALDPWQKLPDGQRLASEIPGSRLEIIEAASHWVQQDAPDEFAKAILGFLDES